MEQKPALSWIVLIYFLGVFLLFALGVTAVQVGLKYGTEEKTIQMNLESRAKTLEPGLITALWNFQTQFLESMLEGLKIDPVIAKVELTDESGEVLASWENPELVPSQNLRFKLPLSHFSQQGGLQVLGYLELASGEEYLQERVFEDLAGNILTILTLLVAVMTTLWVLLQNLVVRSLKNFTEKVVSLTSGNFQTLGTKEEWGIAEIQSLYGSFLALWTQVSERQQEIEASHAALEARVEERTRELRLAKEAAEKASAVKGQFLANMSHEIRTPMNAILGFSALLRGMELGPKEGEYLSKIHLSAENLLRIVNDILDFSKMEAGKMALDIRPFSPRRLLEELSEMFSLQVKAKSLQMVLEVKEHFPPRLLGDALRISQILSNLLSNAVKFTPQGTVRLEARVISAAGNQVTVVFSVEDTGPGISPDLMDTLFQPFSQGDTTITRRHGGTGLGLVLSRDLAQLMGGRLEHRNLEVRGSRFSLTLPMEIPLQEVAAAVEEEVPPAVFPGKKVLVVEDNRINQKLMKAYLDNLEVQSDLAENGLEGVSLVEKGTYDLVLMDLQMPVMGGFEATERIRALSGGAELPVIALTAHAMAGILDDCLAHGMSDFLSKPLQLPDLQKMLSKWFAPVDRKVLLVENFLRMLQDAESTQVFLKNGKKAEAVYMQAIEASAGLPELRVQLLSRPIFLMHLARSGREVLAEEFSREAEELAREQKDPRLLDEALHSRALVLQSSGRYQEASERYREALELARERLSALELARRENGYGYFCFSRGDFTGAHTCYSQALDRLEGLDEAERAGTWVNLAFCRTFVFDHEGAVFCLENAMRIMEALGVDALPFHPRFFILALLGWNKVKCGESGYGEELLDTIEREGAQGLSTGRNRREYEFLLRSALCQSRGDLPGCLSSLDRMMEYLLEIPQETLIVQAFCRLEYLRCLGAAEAAADRTAGVEALKSLLVSAGLRGEYLQALSGDWKRTPLVSVPTWKRG